MFSTFIYTGGGEQNGLWITYRQVNDWFFFFFFFFLNTYQKMRVGKRVKVKKLAATGYATLRFYANAQKLILGPIGTPFNT